MSVWSVANIPSQHGRSAVVTGAGGLGYETALALARAGSEVILAGRSAAKGTASVGAIEAAVPDANIYFELLDLADRFSRLLAPLASQSAADGALPTLFAAVSPNAQPAGYYGPTGFAELTGVVGRARIGRRARDAAVAHRLWDVAEGLTGAAWPAVAREAPHSLLAA